MQVAIIFAATNGYFDYVSSSHLRVIEARLCDYLSREAGGVLTAIRESRELREESEKTLREKLDAFSKRSGAQV
jgi:F-type H+-transporting ATPase subunit alpha